jgi:hypothetical protein
MEGQGKHFPVSAVSLRARRNLYLSKDFASCPGRSEVIRGIFTLTPALSRYEDLVAF